MGEMQPAPQPQYIGDVQVPPPPYMGEIQPVPQESASVSEAPFVPEETAEQKEKICPQCGRKWASGSNFCEECGAKLEDAAAERVTLQEAVGAVKIEQFRTEKQLDRDRLGLRFFLQFKEPFLQCFRLVHCMIGNIMRRQDHARDVFLRGDLPGPETQNRVLLEAHGILPAAVVYSNK